MRIMSDESQIAESAEKEKGEWTDALVADKVKTARAESFGNGLGIGILMVIVAIVVSVVLTQWYSKAKLADEITSMCFGKDVGAMELAKFIDDIRWMGDPEDASIRYVSFDWGREWYKITPPAYESSVVEHCKWDWYDIDLHIGDIVSADTDRANYLFASDRLLNNKASLSDLEAIMEYHNKPEIELGEGEVDY